MSSPLASPNGPAWVVMARGEPYALRDVDGTEVSRDEARSIIAERYQVPEQVRRRRRSRKSAGKAPHRVLEAHAKGHTRHRVDSRGDLPRTTTRPDEPALVKTVEPHAIPALT